MILALCFHLSTITLCLGAIPYVPYQPCPQAHCRYRPPTPRKGRRRRGGGRKKVRALSASLDYIASRKSSPFCSSDLLLS
ncbi:hypothetical protein HOY82DRAFT_15220 [Tuber indicum]|nr:hypothetical protein HOY82DRAFT_15220 [Tuber indicum]